MSMSSFVDTRPNQSRDKTQFNWVPSKTRVKQDEDPIFSNGNRMDMEAKKNRSKSNESKFLVSFYERDFQSLKVKVEDGRAREEGAQPPRHSQITPSSTPKIPSWGGVSGDLGTKSGGIR
eukprot:803936-Prorocentrum_minimum.AAC.2